MPTESRHDPYAELADLVLNVGRTIRHRTATGPEFVPLNETERLVMRVVDLYPGSSPSDIAERSQVQRTNVSAALRALENKGMIVRSTEGRGVAVHPTDFARTNLERLRAGWSDLLAPLLDDDVAAVEQCTRVLAHLEHRLTDT